MIEQVYKLGKTNIVAQAWSKTGRPYIHGWVFDLNTGHIVPQTGVINSAAAMRQICKFNNAVAGH